MESLLKEYIKRRIPPKSLNLNNYKTILIKKLDGGCYNVNYLVKINSKRFIFRINIYNDDFEGANLKNEYFLLRRLNGLYCPKAYFYSKDFKHPLLIEEFISGIKIKRLNNNLIRKIARSLVKIHLSIEPKKKIKIVSIYEFYNSRFNKRLNIIKKNLKMYNELKYFADKAKKYLRENNNKFNKYKSIVLCHGDMHCKNIIQQKDNIIFIDWEGSFFNDPAFDIVAFFYECENLQYFNDTISQNQKTLFLKEYMKINHDNYLKEKIKILYPLKWLSDALWIGCRIVDYENIPLDAREKSKEAYLRLYKFNLKKLKEIWNKGLL